MDGVPPDVVAGGRPRSRAARRRPIASSSHLPTPGTKRPSTSVDSSFPLLSTRKSPPTTTSTRASETPYRNALLSTAQGGKRPPQWTVTGVNTAGEERGASLRARLHASGLKKSILQAQLFPQSASIPSNQEPSESESRTPAPTNTATDPSTVHHRPLDFNVRIKPTGLVPTRPTTSTSLQRQRRAINMPLSAREHSEPVSDRPKQPLSARDRFYVDQRASTAPSRSSNARRRQIGADTPLQATTLAPQLDRQPANNNGESGISRRMAILERRSTFKTFTEGLALHLSRLNQTSGGERGGAGLERDSFLYLRRVDGNPYNLVVASHSEIDPRDYYTVSRLGLTHFSASGSDFVPLDKFEQEHFQYSIIVTLPFFRKYRAWKAFKCWRRAVTSRKRALAVSLLGQEMFVLLPSLRDALFELRSECLGLQRIYLFNLDVQTGADGLGGAAPVTTSQPKAFTLPEFSMHFKAQKTRCERLVDHFMAKTEMIAKRACEKYLHEFLERIGFHDQQARVPESVAARRPSRTSAAVSRVLPSDLESDELGKEMTYTERATMRTQCKKLVKFLRVVEFLVSDALLTVAILSASRLRDEMTAIMRSFDPAKDATTTLESSHARRVSAVMALAALTRTNSPLFRVEVVLGSETFPRLDRDSTASSKLGTSPPRLHRRSSGFLMTSGQSQRSGINQSPAARGAGDLLVFTPSSEALRSQLETLLFNGLLAVTNRERVLCNPKFKTYVQASLDDGVEGDGGDDKGEGECGRETMDLDMMIMEEATFVEALQGINAVVADAFECADDNCQRLAPFLDKFQANIRFCTQIADPSSFMQLEVDEFRAYLDKYTAEVQAVDALGDTSPCGLLLLDYAKLNAQLKPSPRRCLENLHLLLPLVLRHASDALMDDLTAKNDVISSIPTSVDEFADALAFLRKLQAEQEALSDKYGYVRSLFHLVEEYSIKLTDNDQMNAFLLSQKKSQLRTSMDLFESSCDQYAAKFGIELEARLPGLVTQLDDVAKALEHPKLFQLDVDPQEMIPYLTRLEQQVKTLQTSIEQHFHYEKTLSLPLTGAFDDLDALTLDLSLKTAIWRTRSEWMDDVQRWETLRFPVQVDIADLADRIQQYYQAVLSWETQLPTGMHVLCSSLKAMVEEYRFTMPVLADLRCDSFEERHFVELHALLGFNVRHLEAGSAPMTLGELVKMRLTPFSQRIANIATQAAQERSLKLSLDKITSQWERMELDVQPYKETKDCYVLVAYESISSALEESLMGMTSLLSSKFIAPIKDLAITWQRRLLVFQETLDAWVECQRKWMHLETIFSAPDIQKQLPNEGLVFMGVHQFWKDLMKRANDQRACLRISGVSLIGLPTISKLVGDVSLASNPVSGGGGVGQALLEALLKHNASLERIEKSLEDYLETKRGFFPRFYFISNDELLDILAHAREPHAVQRHLGKCFDALSRLEIRHDAAHGGGGGTTLTPGVSTTYDIVAMISPEGERVPFGRLLKARGNVEDWLTTLLANMKATLHRHFKASLLDYQHGSREAWVFRHPAQAATVVSYIVWTKECESCLRSSAQDPTLELRLWHQTICSQLQNLTRVVRTALTPTQRSVVVSLVTTDVHFRDIVDKLVKSGVKDPEDFAWQQQLRYYWHPERDECDVLQANCRVAYGYEYMGVCHRLVITPLTDRCWLTITGALELRYGAAPSGPAGTGKTETSRDLAKGLGILCVVINCSDQVDYKLMGGVFNGVVQAGVWVCLDEFNRIDIEVLSVIAQFMSAIRNARLGMSTDVALGGARVPLREHHIIVTMNPGYVGRTELPDNLKVSFRPVAMMIPDYALIAEIMLFAEGYQLAKPLARKITKLYKLCSEQLSQQTHYDFGMRAVRSVLLMAGNLKRAAAPLSSSGPPMATSEASEEDALLIRAVNVCNYPRLLDQDTPLFNAIVRDLFPQANASAHPGQVQSVDASASFALMGLSPLEDEIRRQLHTHGLQDVREWVGKVLELFATLEIRTGVVQTGSSASGKSTAAKVLRDAVTALREQHRHPDARYQHVASFVLNPKAVSVTELYGFFHPVTREWTDGLASSILRSCILEKNEQLLRQQQHKEAVAAGLTTSSSVAISSTSPTFYWITFDGPIDVLWIESMNTVLDDNKTLCLSNGERIKLLPRIQLVFEVLDTASASPATISRLGVVYFDDKQLGWWPYVTSWLARLGEPDGPIRLGAKLKTRVAKCFELFVDAGLAFIRSTVSGVQLTPIACSDLVFVSSICHLFESLLFQRAPAELFTSAPSRAKASDRSQTVSSAAMSAAAAVAAQLEEQQQRCVDLVFVFSFAWSFGGNLQVDTAVPAFEDLLSSLLDRHEHFLSRDLLSISGKIPTPGVASPVAGNVHDFFIDFRHLSFSPWARDTGVPVALPDSLADRVSSGVLALNELFVPTPDVCKYAHLIELLALDAKKPIFLTGATGSGKSALVHRILDMSATESTSSTGASYTAGASALTARLPPEPQTSCCTQTCRSIYRIHLQFSAQTSSALAQLSIESKFVKKRKTLLGPPAPNQLAVIVVDDINLPSPEKYGAQPPIELLRQYLELGGLYDRDKFFWKDVANSVLLAVGGTPGGGRRPLCPRFVRHFAAILCLPSCRDQAMQTIFQSMIGFHIASQSGGGSRGAAVSKSVKDALFHSVQATCDLFIQVVQTLLPTPRKCHYLFNLRDAVKLMQGVVIGSSSLGSSGSNTTASSTRESTANKASDGGTAEVLGRLWAHESIRVFRDRLTTREDRLWLSEQVVALGNRAFGANWGLDLVTDDVPALSKRRSSMGTLGAAVTGSLSTPQPKSLLFAPTSTGGYQQVAVSAAFEERLGSLMAQYNESSAATPGKNRPRLNLVLFRDAVVHTAAIARILMQPRGHALLLGMGGCGKRSLTRLATFMNGFDYFEVELKQNYGLSDFREDLKAVMMRIVLGKAATADKDGAPAVFLVNTSHLTSDLFLEDVNLLLNGGEIPKLLTSEETEKMVNDVRTLLGSTSRDNVQPQPSSQQLPAVQPCSNKAASSMPPLAGWKSGSSRLADGDYTRKDCELFFQRQVRRGLHIVLCMDPTADVFRTRVLQFPSLINCTTTDFFEDWPAAALQNIADRLLAVSSEPLAHSQAASQLESAPFSPRPSLSTLFVDIHQSAALLAPVFGAASGRAVIVTCQHYLDFLALYQRAQLDKRAAWDQKLQRLTAGVVKLDETNALVHTLREELVGLQPVLVAKAREAEVLLQQLAVDQVEASRVKERVAMDESKVKEQQQEVAACQADAQKDLDQALPALNAAVAALDALDKKDITEVKGFVKPPQAVQVVMEAVCIMLGEKPDWETSKRVLSRSSFMAELKDYDKDNIAASILKKVHRYIENPEFAVDEVKKVSRAAMSLCMWVHAVDTYARVVKEVAPKRQRLAELNAVLADANSRLEAKQQELAGVVERVTRLQDKCDATLAEKQRLLDEAELTKARLQRAEKLTVGLDDERVRWRGSIDALQQQADVMTGDSVLTAACLAYLGAFDSKFRGRLLHKWLAAAVASTRVTQPFSLLESYGDVSELREWQLMGLPSDGFSGDSALCAMKHTARWPLMIDPQQQASQWIRRLERSSRLETSKSGDKGLASVLESCLTITRPLLVEDIGEFIDPALESVLTLRSRYTSASSKTSVQVVGTGGSPRAIEVDLSRFRLYLTTKLALPSFAPDVFVSVCVISFGVTTDGLEEQLLSDVVQRERVEVEERKHRLLGDISRDQRLLVELELKILSLLSGATGNLLDDVELIHALESSKATSTVVAQRLHESEATKKEVLEARDQYRSVAATGAVLYFTIADLAVLDPMYQYSLEYFRRLFTSSLGEVEATSMADGDLSDRLQALKSQLVAVVYLNISRGLFQQHQLLFAFLTTQRLQQRGGELQPQDVRLLDRSTLHLGRDLSQNQSEDAIETGASVVAILLALAHLNEVYQPLLDSYRQDPRAWDAWVSSTDPFKSRMPCEPAHSSTTKLSPFFRLVLVRYLREDVFPSSVASFCSECLPLQTTTSTASSGDSDAVMLDVLRDMNRSTPCLLLLSPGADPESIVARLAASTAGDARVYHAISLGQGQGPLAERKLQECALDGDWLLLQNVHLAKSWLPTLEAICMDLRRDADVSVEVSSSFRLFLAASPVPYFPIAILQNCVKVTTEPPRGIKANLQRSIALLRAVGDSTEVESTPASSGEAGNDGSKAVQVLHGERMDKVKRQLAFGLSLFHAALQERAKFGALGWNLKHDFSDADFLCVVSLQDRLLQRYAARKQKEKRGKGGASVESASYRSLLERDVSVDDEEEEEDEDEAEDDDNLEWVPWDALHYLTGQVYYGGRVTDEFDRRCLMATLTRFYSRQALESSNDLSSLSDARVRRASIHRKSVSLSALPSPPTLWMSALPSLDRYLSEDGGFSVPSFASDEAMARFVDALPDADAPQLVIGMHPNAHVLYQKDQSRRLLSMLWLVQPLQRLGVATDSHDVVENKDEVDVKDDGGSCTAEHAVFKMVDAIHELLNAWTAHANSKTNASGLATMDPFAIVLQQELAQINHVMESIQSSLNVLQAAVQGLAVMSSTTELVFHSLAVGQVPVPWRSLESLESLSGGASATSGAGYTSQSTRGGDEGADGSTNGSGQQVLVWISRLLSRFQFFADWATAQVVPPVLPLSLFCFPEGLFTAALQRHARKHSTPIHHLDFEFRVMDDADPIGLMDMEDRAEDVPADGDGSDSGSAANTGPKDGIYISGLMLEGAQWCSDRHCLCDPEPGAIQHVMPVLHVRAQYSETLAALDNAPGLTPAAGSGPTTVSRLSVVQRGAATGSSSRSPSMRAAPRAPSVSMGSVTGPAYLSRRSSQRTSFRSSRILSNRASSSSMGGVEALSPPLHRYSCPVYKTSSRKGSLSTTGASTNFVLSIELPSERPADHYVLNGAAMVCSRASTSSSTAQQ